uniref:Uncharacterized protein n=1 Tax=Arundo donax TaxID=35708 RepID=A0A0A9HJT4_ARUDO
MANWQYMLVIIMDIPDVDMLSSLTHPEDLKPTSLNCRKSCTNMYNGVSYIWVLESLM